MCGDEKVRSIFKNTETREVLNGFDKVAVEFDNKWISQQFETTDTSCGITTYATFIDQDNSETQV
jgi:hypothetical protein